jgi:hypothetical protein
MCLDGFVINGVVVGGVVPSGNARQQPSINKYIYIYIFRQLTPHTTGAWPGRRGGPAQEHLGDTYSRRVHRCADAAGAGLARAGIRAKPFGHALRGAGTALVYRPAKCVVRRRSRQCHGWQRARLGPHQGTQPRTVPCLQGQHHVTAGHADGRAQPKYLWLPAVGRLCGWCGPAMRSIPAVVSLAHQHHHRRAHHAHGAQPKSFRSRTHGAQCWDRPWPGRQRRLAEPLAPVCGCECGHQPVRSPRPAWQSALVNAATCFHTIHTAGFYSLNTGVGVFRRTPARAGDREHA